MRPRFLFNLFMLASLPAAAYAAPYAQYNPSTGDIRFLDIRDISLIYIRSTSEALNPNIVNAPVNVVPSTLERPTMRLNHGGFDGLTIQYLDPAYRGRLPVTSLTIRGAYLPGTPVADVLYFDTYNARGLRQGIVLEVPEPDREILGSLAIVAFAATRSRQAVR